MKISEIVASKINRFPKGYVFTYSDFTEEVMQKEAIIKALNRLAGSGKITKLSKGKYFKPEVTPFGQLQPDQFQVVKDLLEEGGKTIGYLTGYSIYNELGLTTQVSSTIQIGKNQIRPGFKRERYTILFIRQKNTITKENIPLLQLLDAIRYIKKIPDTTIETSCKRFITIFKAIQEKELPTLTRLAQKYPPATRAIVGAILDEILKSNYTSPLQSSLNPISKYKVPGANLVFGHSDKWNLI